MSKTQSVALLAMFVIVVAGISALAWVWVAPPNELTVYRAMIEQLELTETPLTIMSTPSTCSISTHGVTNGAATQEYDDALVSDFLGANSDGAVAIQIRSLTDLANVVDYDTARQHQFANLPNPVGSPIMRLSRVGFGENGNQALVCIEGLSRVLVLLDLVDGVWQIRSVSPQWTT